MGSNVCTALVLSHILIQITVRMCISNKWHAFGFVCFLGVVHMCLCVVSNQIKWILKDQLPFYRVCASVEKSPLGFLYLFPPDA